MRGPNLADEPPPPIVPFFDRRRLDILFNRFPLKHSWDTLALSQVALRSDLTWKQKLNCIDFYSSTAKIRNLYATLTRSGSHWSLLGIHLALDLAAGGDGDYCYHKELWIPQTGFRYTKIDWRTPTGHAQDIGPVNDPLIFHSHHPYYRIRSAQLKNMKIVIVLRSILESMESKFYKLSKTRDEYRGFPWEKLIEDAIEFYNSWGDVIRWHPNCLVFKYEDLLADTVGCHKQITDHWGLDIPEDCIAEAFSRITKEKMFEKLNVLGNPKQGRVAKRSDDETIPPESRALIQKMIDEKLVYDFGYEFTRDKDV